MNHSETQTTIRFVKWFCYTISENGFGSRNTINSGEKIDTEVHMCTTSKRVELELEYPGWLDFKA